MIFSRHKSFRATETLLPGQISYLKKQAECDEEDLQKVDLSEGCFNHLVVILSTDARNAQAEALILTSFGGRTLEERHPYNRLVRLSHLPIAPAPRHPDNGILLELNGDLSLPKETYVKIDLPYLIPWSMLRVRYRDLRNGKTLEIKPRSFATMLQYVESRLSTNPKLLRKTIASRRATLRGSSRAQVRRIPRLALALRNTLTLLLTVIVFGVALVYIRALFDKMTSWVREFMMQYLGRWSPFQHAEVS